MGNQSVLVYTCYQIQAGEYMQTKKMVLLKYILYLVKQKPRPLARF